MASDPFLDLIQKQHTLGRKTLMAFVRIANIDLPNVNDQEFFEAIVKFTHTIQTLFDRTKDDLTYTAIQLYAGQNNISMDQQDIINAVRFFNIMNDHMVRSILANFIVENYHQSKVIFEFEGNISYLPDSIQLIADSRSCVVIYGESLIQDINNISIVFNDKNYYYVQTLESVNWGIILTRYQFDKYLIKRFMTMIGIGANASILDLMNKIKLFYESNSSKSIYNGNFELDSLKKSILKHFQGQQIKSTIIDKLVKMLLTILEDSIIVSWINQTDLNIHWIIDQGDNIHNFGIRNTRLTNLTISVITINNPQILIQFKDIDKLGEYSKLSNFTYHINWALRFDL